MRSCPKCGRSYPDANINFCLDDGELLLQSDSASSASSLDYEPPTMMMDSARVTKESNWPTVEQPMQQWQPPAPPMTNHIQTAPEQTLPVVSLSLGIGAMTIGWCCSLGLLLAPASIITGIIALNQIKKDPAGHTGRGLAIGGIVTGAIYLLAYIVIMILYGAALLIGNLNN